MAHYIFAAPDSSSADRAAATDLYNGTEWTTTQKGYFSQGGNTIELRPGTYAFSGYLLIGSNTKVYGARTIAIPAKKKTILYPDAANMAVLTCTKGAMGTTVENTSSHARLECNGASNIELRDVYLHGYTGINFPGLKNSKLTRVVISNYFGTFPNGSWANMGYSNATGAFWLGKHGKGSMGSDTVTFTQCIAQFSSHHGFLIAHGNTHTWTRHIKLIDCRAISCGCGQLRGDNAGAIADSKARLPERDGRGYRDWSVAFDLCENGSVEDIECVECYSYDAWKVGFYMEPRKAEPEDTEHYNIRFIRCVAEDSGVRATIGNKTIPKESEASNWYCQRGYFEDCISRRGWKAGYYVSPENHPQDATKTGTWTEGGKVKTGTYRIHMVRCIDCGSRYGYVHEMNQSRDILTENCAAINNTHRAARIYGTGPINYRAFRIKTTNATKSPILVGTMCRLQIAMSRDPGNENDVQNKYLNLGTSPAGAISGTVEGLQAGTPVVQYRPGTSMKGGVSIQPTGTPFTQADLANACEGEPTGGYVPPDDPGDGPLNPLNVAFSGTPTEGVAPLTVQFTDQTEADEIAGWTWTFGDGKTSTLRNPSHTYTEPGTYPVSLAVGDGTYFDAEVKVGYIRVHAPGGDTPQPPVQTGRRFILSDPRIDQAYDGAGAIVATVTVRIDGGD